MVVLFLTMSKFDSIYEKGIYSDLLREFINRGHMVCAISPADEGGKTHIIYEDDNRILRLGLVDNQKSGVIKKGIATVAFGIVAKRAIKKYFAKIKFDLVLYSTPPITLVGAIEYVKKRDRARTYLLLKDIFPQNAVDIGMMCKSGIKGLLYRYFRKKEKSLYAISDRIGCMSEANVRYVLEHNPDVKKRNINSLKKNGISIVETCPNCIEVIDMSVTMEERIAVRETYGIPRDRVVFIYGGNLGKPQGIPFMLRCLYSQRENNKAFFIIVGSGTEYNLIKRYLDRYKPENVALYGFLSKPEYDLLVASCDIGMIFLDHRFTIPNFPSRLLSYMQAKIPVFAVTDPNTDIGKVILEGKFGWWSESGDLESFVKQINSVCDDGHREKGKNAFDYLVRHYDVENCVEKIISSVDLDNCLE